MRLAEYLIELGWGRATDAHRPIWLQEIDAPAQGQTAVGREECRQGGRFFDAWMELAIAGERPTVVLGHQAKDPAALNARGVTRVECI